MSKYIIKGIPRITVKIINHHYWSRVNSYRLPEEANYVQTSVVASRFMRGLHKCHVISEQTLSTATILYFNT